MHFITWKPILAGTALTLLLGLGAASARAEDELSPAPAPAAAKSAVAPPVGDLRKIEFVLPFKQALAKAKAEKRLLFIKPIYGGVNQQGADDYRCGSW